MATHNTNPYNNSRWTIISKWKRNKDPMCEYCASKLYAPQPADVVDHYIEINDGGEIYGEWNLISACHSMHNIKTGACKRMRDKGMPWLAKYYLENVPNGREDIKQYVKEWMRDNNIELPRMFI